MTSSSSEVVQQQSASISDFFVRQWWWMKRVLFLPLYILAFSVLAFFLVRLVPGDPVLIMTEGKATPEQYAALSAQLGLDKGPLTSFIDFMAGLFRGDLGTSLGTGKPVVQDILVRLPKTLEFVTLGLVGTIIVAFLLSLVVAMSRERSWASRLVRGVSQTAGVIPDFAIGVLLIMVLYSVLKIVPTPIGRASPGQSIPSGPTGFPILDAMLAGDFALLGPMLAHLVLPILAMVLAQVPILLKQFVYSLDSNVDSESLRFRASCKNPKRVLLASLYRRSMPSVMVMIGIIFRGLLGAAVILEIMFGLNGLGQYAVDAVNNSDFIALRGFIIAMGFISLVTFYILVDVLILIVDPQRRQSHVGA